MLPYAAFGPVLKPGWISVWTKNSCLQINLNKRISGCPLWMAPKGRFGAFQKMTNFCDARKLFKRLFWKKKKDFFSLPLARFYDLAISNQTSEAKNLEPDIRSWKFLTRHFYINFRRRTSRERAAICFRYPRSWGWCHSSATYPDPGRGKQDSHHPDPRGSADPLGRDQGSDQSCRWKGWCVSWTLIFKEIWLGD